MNKFQLLDDGLIVNKISKTYGNKKVVTDISLTIKRGEIVGLLGPNGAGKTTTFYMIVGLVKPDGGTIIMDKIEITKTPIYSRGSKGIGYLPQEPSIFRGMSVEDNLLSIIEVVEKDKSYLSQFPKGFNLLFAGNIGVAQSFDTVVNAFEKLKEHDINLVVLGDGRDKSRIQEEIQEKGLTNKFHFLGSFPPEQMPYYFTCADGLLITLKKADIFSYTIPGKLQSYLACGKPIIGALDGIGNKIISESNSGFASEAENYELLANNILKLYELSKAEKGKLSNNALTYFDKNFNKQYLLERLEEILN